MFLQPRAETLPACGYVGNSEVYGLGIRVGIYLQWVSSLLCKAFLDDESLRDILNENATFLLAIFLATILLVTDTISGVHNIDVLIMLHIFFGSIFTVFFGADIGERIEYFSSLVGIIFKTGMVTGMAAIGVWFWFYDIHAPVEPVCSSFAFLFGRVGLYSKHTLLSFKVFSAFNLMYCAAFLFFMIGVRFSVFCWTLALTDSDALKDYDSSMKYSALLGLSGWELLILKRFVTNKKKLLEDIRVLGTELIIQSTVPSKGKYLDQFNKLVEEQHQINQGNTLAQNDWHTVRKRLVERRDQQDQSGSRSILDAILKVGDFVDGPTRSSIGPIPNDEILVSAYTFLRPPAIRKQPPDDNVDVFERVLKTYRYVPFAIARACTSKAKQF
jgi:hypothetical protein